MANFLGVLCNTCRENGTTPWERCFMSLDPGTKDCISMVAELLPHEPDFSMNQVKASVEVAVAEHPRLREVLSDCGLWEEVELDLEADHLRWIQDAGESKGKEEDPGIVLAMQNMPAFDDASGRTPRWQVIATPRKLVFHVHHAAVDGVGIVVITSTLLFGKSLRETVQEMLPMAEKSRRKHGSAQPDCSGSCCEGLTAMGSCMRHVGAPFRGLLFPEAKSPISAPSDAARPSQIRYFHLGPYPLSAVREEARASGVTVNSVLLRQVTAGLQDYCESQGAARISNFTVAIPISFKVPDADVPERMKANNNFSTLVLKVPQKSRMSCSSDEESCEEVHYVSPEEWSRGHAVGAWAAQGLLSLLPMAIVISNVSLGFWLIDMPMNLIFGIETRGTLEMRPSVLARRYARSWLAIDVALVSLDITLVLIEVMQQVEMRSQAVWRSARFLRSLRLLRLLRLLRVAKLQQELMIVANRLLSTHAFMLSKVIVAVLVMLLVNHIIACLWYGIGAMYLDGRSWLIEGQIQDAPFAQVYAASLHWALTQFTPATNNIAPDNALERAFAVVVILLAIGLFSSCITAITSTMASLRTARSQKSAHQAKLFQFFNDRKLSVGLYGKVQEVLEKDGHFEVRVQERDVDLLQKIPQRLKIQLHEEMFRTPLYSLGIWPTVDVPENHFFYSHLCHSAMSEHIATPTQDAYIPGTDCPHVYIIDAGSMSYFCRGGSQQRASVAEGEILCLPTLWADWHHRGRLTANTTTCVYITLNSEQFGLLVSKVGGSMWQHLQIFGILLVSEIENMDQNSCQRNSVSDLSLGQKKLDELVVRAERFASILKQNKDPAGPPDRMDSFRSRINVKGGDRSYAISSQLLTPSDEIFDPKSMVTATI